MWELIVITCLATEGLCIHESYWFDSLSTCQAVGSSYIEADVRCESDSVAYDLVDGAWLQTGEAI